MIYNFLQIVFKNIFFTIDTNEKVVFITFDDGPNQNITQHYLNILNEYDAKATFFCLGKNCEKHSELINKITEHGHAVGNHSYSHLNGWNTNNFTYFKDILNKSNVNSNLFRPPYGKISLRQLLTLKKKFKIVFWDILCNDYEKDFDLEKTFLKIKNSIKNGSIIVFHDNEKSYENTKQILPLVLDYLKSEGFKFNKLEL